VLASGIVKPAPMPALADPAGAVPSPELFVRWQQVASLLPGFEAPAAVDPTAPFQFAEPYAGAARAAIARRAVLWPYLEAVFMRAAAQGTSPLLPLVSPVANVAAADASAPAFTIGSSLLVAPVVTEGASSVVLYLPPGAAWIDWYTGQPYDGGQTIVVATPLERIPLFVRQIAP
jgi:alpha-glucosidase